MDIFNEQSLYNAIVSMWGENGAHAEVYRDICKKAEIELANEPVLSIEELVMKIYNETGQSKIETIKAIRWREEEGLYHLGLKEAKDLVDRVIGQVHRR